MLHFLSFAETIPYLAVALFLFYSCGYVSLNKILKVDLRKTYGTLISLPIYLSAGIVLCTFVLYAIGLVIFNQLIVYLVTILIVALFLAKLLLSARRSGSTGMKMALEKLRGYNATTLPCAVEKIFPSLIAGLVFVISFLYLTNVIAIFEWPPKGDIIAHGFYTSLIIYDQRIPTNFYPFVDAAFHYPLGLHVSAAFLALLLGIYPGEAVLLLGGILMIALTSLVFALTYVITSSKLLSFSTYVLLYLTYSVGSGGDGLEDWLFGYLFNGPYPNIYGFLIVLLSITTLVIYGKTKDRYTLLILYPILTIVLLLTYPNFVFVSLIFFVPAILQVGVRNLLNEFFKTRRGTLVITLLAIAVVLFALYVFFGVFAAQMSYGGMISSAYVLRPEYLLNSVFGYSIIFAAILSSLLVVFSSNKVNRHSPASSLQSQLRELRPILVGYVLTTLILFLSLNTTLYIVLQYLLPHRLAILTMVLSLLLNVYALGKIFYVVIERPLRTTIVEERCTPPLLGRISRYPVINKLNRSRVLRKVRRSAPRKILPMTRNVVVVLMVFAFFNPGGLLAYSVVSHASLYLANRWGWYSHSPSFDSDFKAMEWICENVKHGELIINDWSWNGLYLTSLSAENVTMQYMLLGLRRTIEVQNIWLNPGNGTSLYGLIKKYNVSYILCTSDWGYFDVFHDWRYKNKPYDPAIYIEYFSGFSFLELVFRSGNSAVFKTK